MNKEFYIKRVLRLASKARGLTSPNPMVGAVLVKNKKIVSEDYHKLPGGPHAEALVIETAGKNAHGATLYVNLEPCCHIEKRTPPCTRSIINAGIRKVIISMSDPNPKVSGRGISELEEAGIQVQIGILEKEARKLNEFYIKYITSGRPFAILKIAMTLDGKIATPDGQSKWITGVEARKMVHYTRSCVDAVLTAIGTVKADDPQMTSRTKRGKNPLRVVIDPYLEISPNAKVLQIPPDTIIVTKKSDKRVLNEKVIEKKKKIYNKGVQILEYRGKKVNLVWLLEKLGRQGITSILIEGGSSLNAYALKAGIVDKVMFYIAPKIIGGMKSFPAIGGETYRRLEEAYRVKGAKMKKIGEDFLIEGYIEGR
jgi:diaminohydroxyphosphoribosylaminopyrimidine deaminase/5-amino-6-(5-phosphoribosylamino)uracil reductase